MNVFDSKHNNKKKIYHYIREKGLATKQDIAYNLQLSLPTVAQKLEDLVVRGLVGAECKVANKAGGRNPVAYTYVKDAKVAVGLDITKRHIKSVIIDLDGNIIKYVYRRRLYQRNDGYLKTLGETVEKIIDSIGLSRDKVIGVGIAVPGLIDFEKQCVVRGTVIDNTGMSREDFSTYIQYPTKLIHDSNASGFCEIWMSSELRNAFYISLCNSVGGTVLIDNEVYMGDGLYSGEVGHLNLVTDGMQCYCGQKGCADAYLNAERLADYTNRDLGMFFLRLEQGDGVLKEIWDEYLEYLAVLIHDIRMMFGSTIIVGGYVGIFIKDYMEVLCEKVNRKNPFGEDAAGYIMPCNNNTEAVATGAALYFVKEFIEAI
ncbi:ROK family protein [Anaerobium acetethylicum]|uniref:Sugar kinase of the NBD/HSP70 family, may contain an N-terminal HTH domain n=1 Tax=Anaerobium acetethylicum TaxID=1619234 RepID=A0A1D3TUF2_9FIRM|nr:ROK family protein [Anaerobium acetethylicum]SCP97707.1 Sugar kinase of the NBD/HSP70 family, may contain an N-terminal HTH domain [Anaerobium acetethylicum]